MKKLLLLLILIAATIIVSAQTVSRPDVCPACIEDTTGGYISIADTLKLNPICNFELLTAAHLNNDVQQDRDSISFFPNRLDKLYKKSGDSRGHTIPFEDLAYSPITAKASMDLRRNLAPQPQAQNIGTKLATENYGRKLAKQYGSVKIYGGTFGHIGLMNGINKPAIYWTVIITPDATLVYWMPTTGDKIAYRFMNDPAITISYADLVNNLGFDPIKILP